MNLGSPDSPSPSDVRKYLREFLMDGRVLDAPWPIRFGIVHLAILPRRPKESAHAYQKVWTAEGSPLVATSKRVQARLQERLSIPVKLAMRYQNPSIEDTINHLHYDGVEELLLIPLFPHYAMSSYETAVVQVKQVAARQAPQMRMVVQPPYYNDPDYITVRIDAYNTFRVITPDMDDEAPSYQELLLKLRAAKQGGANGKVPKMNASEVMMMGRNRKCAAASAASTGLLPSASRSFANSMIRMAFFADRPMMVMSPT